MARFLENFLVSREAFKEVVTRSEDMKGLGRRENKKGLEKGEEEKGGKRKGKRERAEKSPALELKPLSSFQRSRR